MNRLRELNDTVEALKLAPIEDTLVEEIPSDEPTAYTEDDAHGYVALAVWLVVVFVLGVMGALCLTLGILFSDPAGIVFAVAFAAIGMSYTVHVLKGNR